jgi:hypothetical protein
MVCYPDIGGIVDHLCLSFLEVSGDGFHQYQDNEPPPLT